VQKATDLAEGRIFRLFLALESIAIAKAGEVGFLPLLLKAGKLVLAFLFMGTIADRHLAGVDIVDRAHD
jgi:hypothetical protein